MFGLWKTSEETPAESLRKRVNQLEIDVEALKLERAAQALAVLNACEKVLHQLGARERKRSEEIPSEDPPQPTIDAAPFRGDQVAERRRRSNY